MTSAPLEAAGDGAISHGICQECLETLFASMGDPLQDFLDSLGVPVLVTDDDVRVGGVSQQARDLLHKELADILGHLGGEVFECSFSRLPGGCGRTIHCSGCAIRNTVTDTHASGQSHVNVPAVLKRGEVEDSQQVDLLISTEKVRDKVLLRIDRVGKP